MQHAGQKRHSIPPVQPRTGWQETQRARNDRAELPPAGLACGVVSHKQAPPKGNAHPAKTSGYSGFPSGQRAKSSAIEPETPPIDAAMSMMDPDVDTPSVRDLAASAVIDAASAHPCCLSKVGASVSCAAQAIAQFQAEDGAEVDDDATFEAAFRDEIHVQCDLLRQCIPDPRG